MTTSWFSSWIGNFLFSERLGVQTEGQDFTRFWLLFKNGLPQFHMSVLYLNAHRWIGGWHFSKWNHEEFVQQVLFLTFQAFKWCLRCLNTDIFFKYWLWSMTVFDMLVCGDIFNFCSFPPPVRRNISHRHLAFRQKRRESLSNHTCQNCSFWQKVFALNQWVYIILGGIQSRQLM